MPFPRINAWIVYPPPETWGGVLAQSEITVEKAVRGVMDTGKEFGNSNDSVRLGIISVFFVAAICVLVWLLLKVVLAQNKSIVDDLRLQITKAEARAKEIADVAEREREGRREDQYARNAVMQYTIDAFNAKFPELKGDLKAIYASVTSNEDLLRRQLGLGAIPPRQLEESRRIQVPPIVEPPTGPQPHGEPRSNFLPAGPRRIPRRAQPVEEPKE